MAWPLFLVPASAVLFGIVGWRTVSMVNARFPDAAPRSRWRWTAWIPILGVVLIIAAVASTPNPLVLFPGAALITITFLWCLYMNRRDRKDKYKS